MNPFGVSGNIFQTQANQSANSFSDPLNVAHLYPGWGTNPNYQTPAYDAPYRPSYQGPNPYTAYQKPTFMGGVNQIVNPMYQDPYWGNPVSHTQGAYNSVGQKPFDAAATVGQRFIMPALAMGMTQSLLRGSGSAIGKGMLSGLANGLGMGGIAGGAGAVGGFVGGLALPFAAGLGVAHAADSAIFQPYIRSRQMANTVQDNFSGVTFGGTGGNPVSGRGLSAFQSAQIGSQIDRAGIRDMTFSANQVGAIGAMGMRAGLFDDVGSGDIAKKVSSIAAQIKTIVAISKDPNIQTAIEELARLRMGGASTAGGAGSVAAGAYSSLGMYASAAGASVQRMMGTVGGQGQYLYQMNGLTPYLGQIAAASTYSGFASAQRNGLLGTAQLARMGGIEGATQSSMAAQLAGAMTPFNQMGLVNRFMGGNRTSGVVSTVSNFGGLASRDPLRMSGDMSLYGNAMTSRQMGEDGPRVAEDQAVEILRNMGRRPGPNGKFSPGEVAAVMQNVMGMTPDQVQAYAAQRASQTDSTTVAQNVKGFRAQNQEQLRQIITQNGLYAGKIGRTVTAFRQGWKGFKEGTADLLAYPVNEASGKVTDYIQGEMDELLYGKTTRDLNTDRLGVTKKLDMKSISRKFKGGIYKQTASRQKLISKLDEASFKPGPEGDIARELLSKGFQDPSAKALFTKFLALQSDPVLRREYEGLENSGAFFDQIASDVRGGIVDAKAFDKDVGADLAGITNGGSSVLDNLKVIGQAQGLLEETYKAGDKLGLVLGDKLKDEKYAALAGNLKGLSPSQQAARIKSMVVQGLDKGLYGSARIAASGKLSLAEVTKRAGGSLRGQSQTIPGEAISRDNFNETYLAVTGSMNAATDATEKAYKDSSSSVDWGEFTTATSNLDKGAKTLLDAATKLNDLADRAGVGSPYDSGRGFLKGLFK